MAHRPRPRGRQRGAKTTLTPVAAPTATGRLAAVELTAGAAATTIDVATAFAGTVNTYSATSSHPTTVSASTAGSVLSLTPRAAGTATITVTATNTTGSATQSLAVTVNLPPAPTLGAPLAAQTLQVTETLTIDVAAGFTGRIDTYTATSGNTNMSRVIVCCTGSGLSLIKELSDGQDVEQEP